MSRNERQGPRAPATKMLNLQKEMARAETAEVKNEGEGEALL